MILYIYVSKQVHVSGCVKTLPRGVGTSRLAGENMLKPAAVPTACARPGEQLMDNGCECLFKRCFGRRGVVVNGVGGGPRQAVDVDLRYDSAAEAAAVPASCLGRVGQEAGHKQAGDWTGCILGQLLAVDCCLGGSSSCNN